MDSLQQQQLCLGYNDLICLRFGLRPRVNLPRPFFETGCATQDQKSPSQIVYLNYLPFYTSISCMRDHINFLVFSFCLMQLACETPKEEQASFDLKAPRIVEAKSHKIPSEKTVPAKVVPVVGVKSVVAGKPEVVYIKSNVFPARPTRIISAGSPKLVIPNGEHFKPPEVVVAVDSPFIAGPPERILLKEPFIKENNPESFSSIKATHGLNSNEISSLYQDRAGNLWIGAWWGGVSKYDGRFLTNYSVAQGLSSDVVNCIFEDNKGNIWIGTGDGGVNKFDGTYITHYSLKEGLGSSLVWTILQDKSGDMWFATGNGLARFDGHSFTHYRSAQGLSERGVMTMFEDSNGNLWAGSHGGLARFDGQSFLHCTSAIGPKNEATEVLSILEEDGKIWFATNNNGLFKYDGQNISWYTTEGGLSSDLLTKIMKDANGDIWIGTWNRGANKYDGKSFTHFGVEQGLGNELVPAILQDNRGNIWVATTAGVNKYDGKLFSQIMPLRQEEVESVFADSHGNIWIGTGAGSCLNKYDGKSISRYTTGQGLASTTINQMIEDRYGNIWFGARAGVDKYDGSRFTNYSTKNGLINDVVFCLLEDKKGNFWFGTENGLSKFDGQVFTNYSITLGLKGEGETIYSLMEDHLGNIWIGTDNNGVYSFDGTAFTHYDVDHSLSHPMVLGMMQDRNNNIWICTGMGVNKFDGKYFTWYTTAQGLSNNIAKNLLEDNNGNIWVGTISGMNLFRSPTANSKEYFKKYTISEGFLGGGTYENSITQDRNGNIWVGATDRVTHYHPEGDIPDSIPPVIQLRSIAMFNENVNWLDAEKKMDSTIILNNGSRLKNFHFSGLTPWYHQPENLQLSYNNNYLSFQFIGITTYRSKEVRYQYFLDGFDENWSSITDQPEATYNNLPPGKYTFKAKAANSEGYWSKELNYSFVIRPPWWRTWWAYLAYATSFSIMIWMVTWYRSRQLKAENVRLEEKVDKRTVELEQSLSERYHLIKKVESQEALLKERLRISRELHDDIGSTLSSISIYSEVAKQRTEKGETTSEVLAKIGHASRELIGKMSDIVWSLNPNNESFEQLQNRMNAFAVMILSTRSILYHFTADDNLRMVQFTGEQRKNIFLIFKEALHNIVKYADCKTVDVTLSICNKNLVMLIKDDGKGFDVSKVARNGIIPGELMGGNGIKNMQARAEDINAIINIHSKMHEGTTIQLTLLL
jgi:ligand-binding sensor domain-containing protein/signal transduction histidine kinase